MKLPAWIAIPFLFVSVARAADYAIGADLSFLKQAEDKGAHFKVDGKPEPGLQIFKPKFFCPFWASQDPAIR